MNSLPIGQNGSREDTLLKIIDGRMFDKNKKVSLSIWEPLGRGVSLWSGTDSKCSGIQLEPERRYSLSLGVSLRKAVKAELVKAQDRYLSAPMAILESSFRSLPDQ